MIRVRIAAFRSKFTRYKDIDDDSLFVDIKGDVWRRWKNYDPSQRAPRSHAYQLATRAIQDKLRSLDGNPHSAYQLPDESDDVGPEASADVNEADLISLIERFYAQAKDYWDKPGLFQGPIVGPGRPTLTWPQKTALTLLQRHMHWSYRDIEGYTDRFPGILGAIGVTEPKSHQFFFRSVVAVTKFTKKQKRILAIQAAQMPAA